MERTGADPDTLHRAARRYLVDRYAELNESYAELCDGRVGPGEQDRPEAQRIYPRYNVVEAILEQVERLDSEDLPDLPQLTSALLGAAEAQSAFTRPDSKLAAEAIADERRRFTSTVRRWLAGDAPGSEPAPDVRASQDPLGYRRVLAADESARWRERVQRRWDVQGLIWYPMLASPVPPDVLVLDETAAWGESGVARIREALARTGSRRIVELREYGPDYLLDLQMFAPCYTGAEGVWTDDGLDWIAYASHEGTLAFGGLLAAVLPAIWPELNQWRWSGW